MKKRIGIIISLFLISSVSLYAQSSDICRLGFSYLISQSNNWAKGKPLIQAIIPYSPAEQAGLKPFDIIESISGIPVEQIGLNEIESLLNPTDQNEVLLTISNVSFTGKQVLVRKECKKANSITEDQLASAFAMYSLESTTERDFVCPFKTTTTADPVDFTRFKTFAFAAVDPDNRALESTINESIHNELSKKGFKLTTQQPDLLIQTFYFFDKNPNFKGTNKLVVNKEPVYRYNIGRNQMEKLPFLSPATSDTEVEYLLQLGIRIIDQVVLPGRVLWECEANELMEESFRLDEYARIHIPLMCMQYPYVKYTRNVPFHVNKKIYNYTGINFDIDRLEQVTDVDPNSPAYAAGIRPRDVIERIGRQKMNHSAEEFTSAYKRFITASWNLRDPKTQYTDANGFSPCMYWDTFKYPMIAELMQKNEFFPAFTYLYNFAPYVNSSGNNICTFDIKRGKEKLEIVVRPTLRTEVSVELQ